jgi:hypothetical protein
MLGPNAISAGVAFRKSASAARAAARAASVSMLEGYCQWVFALWFKR